MKSYRITLSVGSEKRRELIQITENIEKAIQNSDVKEGLVLVSALDNTAGVFVCEAEPGLYHDFELWLDEIAAEKPYDKYWHNGMDVDNADAHLKRAVIGRESVFAITEGKLDMGENEQIFFFELDGMKAKSVLIKIIGESNEAAGFPAASFSLCA